MSSFVKEVKQTVEQTQTFCSDSIRFLNKCSKPDKKEFKKIATSCAIGFAIMGVVGYLIKLVFIPINNIILN